MMIPEKDRDLGSGRYKLLAERIEKSIQDQSAAGNSEWLYLCQCYSRLKQYKKLFSCVDSLEKNTRKGNTKRQIEAGGTSAHFPFFHVTPFPDLFRAEAYIELGDYDKAIASSRKAYETAQSTDWHRIDRSAFWDKRCSIRALGLLALAHALRGDRTQALSYAGEIEKIRGPLGFFNAIVEMERSLSLARVSMALGQYDQILARKESLLYSFATIANTVFGGSLSGDDLFAFAELPKQFMLTKALYETGHIREAKEGYDKLLNNPSTKINGELYWPILFDRGRIAETEGNGKKAIEYYRAAIDTIEIQRSTIRTEAARIGFVGDKQKIYHRIIGALYRENLFEEAFEYAERSKSRALVDLLASKHEFGTHGRSDLNVASILRDMEDLEKDSHALDSGSIRTDERNRRNARVIKIREKLNRSAPELATLVTVTKVDVGEIQRRLKKDETLLEYYSRGEDLYCFLLTAERLKAVKLAGSNLAQEIEAFRKAIEISSPAEVASCSEKLSDRLLKPIEHEIRTPKLIIVAHGSLHYLPFAALQHGGGSLLDRFGISHLPSASMLPLLKGRERRKDARILLIGNPDLGDPRQDLQYAERETRAIAKLYPEARVYLRDKATKAAFFREASRYDYIHFATHGVFREDSPLHSGLFLAEEGGTGGFLAVSELFSLDLKSDLVTLSACETGLGKISNGDDVVGFTRGFLYAGTGSIVASLWRVDDLATSFLMTEFYANLKTMDKRESLRQAQLATKKKYPSPYYWASFQVTGNSD